MTGPAAEDLTKGAQRTREPQQNDNAPSVSVKVWGDFVSDGPVNENHPVLNALRQQLDALRRQYRQQPNEQSRYQLVRHEQLIAQWAPRQDLSVNA